MLATTATYDTERASWYESMGIMVSWMADGEPAVTIRSPPRSTCEGELTHGHLPENDNHGGAPTEDYVDLTKLPSARRRPPSRSPTSSTPTAT